MSILIQKRPSVTGGSVSMQKQMTNDMSTVLPVLSYQSEARVWQQKRGDFGTILKEKLNDRRCGYIGCLDYSLDIKGIKEWCPKWRWKPFGTEKKWKSMRLLRT